MSGQLAALGFAAADPVALARFWSAVLQWRTAAGPDEAVDLLPTDDTGFALRFRPSAEPKTRKNQMHLDLTSTSLDDQKALVDTALRLGARHLDVGQRPKERHVVLADPEGNEFCVIEPENVFLADCGLLGAVACDGSQDVGYFWSQVLGWPLVWDQDEETAIRSPLGGPKITWGGPPVPPTTEPNRVWFELAVSDGRASLSTELGRLASLGSALLTPPQHAATSVTLSDPDGNEYRVISPGDRKRENPRTP